MGVDPSEGPDVLRGYQQANGYPWLVARGDRAFLESYNMNATAAKVAVERSGVVAWHGGHTVEDLSTWERVFEGLARQ